MGLKSFVKDENGNIVPSGMGISDILNVAINTSTYVPIAIPDATYCKAFKMQTRDGSPFLVSNVVGGTTYSTENQPLSMNFVGIPAKVLCYVKATVAGTLEVILLD